MKTTFYLTCTCLISTFAFFGALGQKNPFPCFAAAFGIWALFIWGYRRRSKKEAAKRFREQMFENYMRSTMRGRIRKYICSKN